MMLIIKKLVILLICLILLICVASPCTHASTIPPGGVSYENKATFAPLSYGGGSVEDVSTSEPGPVNELKTWKFTKTGTSNQWQGWESDYFGAFNCKAGDTWTISGYYKTSNAAGCTELTGTHFAKPGWAGDYDTTVIESNMTITADGKWHYFYTTVRANEDMTNAIIADGPSWWYSGSAGALYINGLQWVKNKTANNEKPIIFNASINSEKNIVLKGSDYQDIKNKIITITYNSDELELLDACSLTNKFDIPVTPFGTIDGTNIVVLDFKPGIVRFRIEKEISQGKSWSGIINVLKFRSKVNRQSVITYSIQ